MTLTGWMTEEFAKISIEEAERRRAHVRSAFANSRLAGMAEIGSEEQAVFDAYVRGEIEGADLMTAYKEGRLRTDHA